MTINWSQVDLQPCMVTAANTAELLLVLIYMKLIASVSMEHVNNQTFYFCLKLK